MPTNCLLQQNDVMLGKHVLEIMGIKFQLGQAIDVPREDRKMDLTQGFLFPRRGGGSGFGGGGPQ